MKLSLRKVSWNDWPSLALAVAFPITWIIAIVFPLIRRGATFSPLIATGVTIGLCVLLSWRILAMRRIWVAGTAAKGRVLAVRIAKDRGRFEYEYDVEGKKVHSWCPVHKTKHVLSFTGGDSVTVRYDPARPTKSIVEDLFAQKTGNANPKDSSRA